MNTFIRRSAVIALSATALTVASSRSTPAQQAVSSTRWQGWLGCWTVGAKDMAPDLGGDAPRIVCVVPTADVDVVNVVAVANGEVVSRDRIDASGRAQTIDANGCTGSQTARWSADNRRVYLKSSVACEGTPIETSVILALTSSGDWLDIRSVAAGVANGANVRVARYRDVGLPSVVPTEITTALAERSKSIQVARKWAGESVESGAIIEAHKVMGGDVVEAWVLESGQRYAVDTPALMALADAGVPASVTDAMIEVTNEEREYRRSKIYGYGYGYPRFGRSASGWWDQSTGQRLVFPRYADLDPWGGGYGWGRGAVGAGLWPYDHRYGSAPFGLGFGPFFGIGSGFGFGFGGSVGYGYGFVPAYLLSSESNSPRARIGYFRPPVLVLKNDAPGTEARGGGRSVTKGDGEVADITRQVVEQVVAAKGGKVTPTPPARPSGSAQAPNKRK